MSFLEAEGWHYLAGNSINRKTKRDVLYTDDMDIHCGGMDDMEQKVNAIAALLAKEDLPKGILHIEDLDQQVYIEPKND